LIAGAAQAAAPRYSGVKEDPAAQSGPPPFSDSLGKIERMLNALDHSGFASFAEG
jgi:hypothetical protein